MILNSEIMPNLLIGIHGLVIFRIFITIEEINSEMKVLPHSDIAHLIFVCRIWLLEYLNSKYMAVCRSVNRASGVVRPSLLSYICRFTTYYRPCLSLCRYTPNQACWNYFLYVYVLHMGHFPIGYPSKKYGPFVQKRIWADDSLIWDLLQFQLFI